MFTHVLLPTDGSHLSRAAIEKGVQLAKALKARVTGVTVVPREPYSLYQTDITLQVKEETARLHRKEAARRLEELQKIAMQAGVPCETVCESSDHPYEAIVAAAATRGCDLIVMASHGRRGVRGVLLGSETQKVLTHSKIPVLVFR
jgi:nucleotide-binding universal stress UspA family protein